MPGAISVCRRRKNKSSPTAHRGCPGNEGRSLPGSSAPLASRIATRHDAKRSGVGVKPDLFAERNCGLPRFERKFPPERVDDLDADADMAEQFAAQLAADHECPLRPGTFPTVFRNREPGPRPAKVPIQPGIRSAKGIGRAHHLRGVSEKAAPESVMIVTRRCRPPETRRRTLPRNASQASSRGSVKSVTRWNILQNRPERAARRESSPSNSSLASSALKGR